MVNLRQETTISGSRIFPPTSRGRACLATVGILLVLLVQPSAGLEITGTSVKSKLGEPLDATVRISLAPGEQIGADCLSLADQPELAESGHVLITDAALSLLGGNGPIRFTTPAPLTEPAVSLALKAQCATGPAVVRVVNLYLDPAVSSLNVATNPAMPGSTFTVRAGDSVYKLARLIYPHNETAVRNLARAIVLANPALFPDGRARPLQIAERLIIPDLRTVQRIIAASAPKDTNAARRSGHEQTGSALKSEPAVNAATASPAKRLKRPSKQARSGKGSGYKVLPSGKLKLKLATDLGRNGSRPRTQHRQAAQHPSAATVAPSAVPVSKAVSLQLSMISTRIDRLRELQDALNTRLARLEVNTIALQKAFGYNEALRRNRPAAASQQAATQTMPPTPPQSAVTNRRTMVPQSQWFIIGGLLIVVLLAGFMLARVFRNQQNMNRHRDRIDAMLEEARTAATPLLGTEPGLSVHEARSVIPESRYEDESVQDYAPGDEREPGGPGEIVPQVDAVEVVNDPWREPDTRLPEVDTEPAAPDEVPAWLRHEMDKAMDSTRSMFSDVDRFITLGRIENAISLLEFQIKRNPTDRNAWIKLMAVYRDRGLDDNFGRTYAVFREQFGDNPGY